MESAARSVKDPGEDHERQPILHWSLAMIHDDRRAVTFLLLHLAIAACADSVPTSSASRNFVLDLAAHDAVRAYVTNVTADVVSVLDVNSNTVVAEIPVGDGPVGIALSPDGSRAYVADFISDQVTVIATSVNLVVGTIPVGDQPVYVAVSPDGTRGYVANSAGASVSVFNLATNNVIATVPVERDWIPADLEVSPDGAKVYATNHLGSSAPDPRDGIVVIDAATLTLEQYIPVDADDPTAIDFTAAGDRAYIGHLHPSSAPRITILETATNVATSFLLPGMWHLREIALSPDETRLYVAANFDPNLPTDVVLVVDAEDPSAVTATIPVGDGPNGVALTPDGVRLLVANELSNDVSVIATSTNSVVATIPTAARPSRIAVGVVRVDPADVAADLEEAVDHLVETGAIGSAEANGLRNKLREAAHQMELGNASAARALIAAFISQIEASVRAGVISAAAAGPLLAAARTLLADIAS